MAGGILRFWAPMTGSYRAGYCVHRRQGRARRSTSRRCWRCMVARWPCTAMASLWSSSCWWRVATPSSTPTRAAAPAGRGVHHCILNDWGGKATKTLSPGWTTRCHGRHRYDRLGVTGGSYGGFMTNWAVGHSDRFKAAVTMRSVVSMATMFGVSDIGWELTVDELGGATRWTSRSGGAVLALQLRSEHPHAAADSA